MSAARAALSAMRRVVKAPKGVRKMSGGHSEAEAEAEMIKWRGITAVVVPGSVLLGGYLASQHGHGHDSEHPKFDYLHIRKKEFPWGPNGFFERPKSEHH